MTILQFVDAHFVGLCIVTVLLTLLFVNRNPKP